MNTKKIPKDPFKNKCFMETTEKIFNKRRDHSQLFSIFIISGTRIAIQLAAPPRPRRDAPRFRSERCRLLQRFHHHRRLLRHGRRQR